MFTSLSENSTRLRIFRENSNLSLSLVPRMPSTSTRHTYEIFQKSSFTLFIDRPYAYNRQKNQIYASISKITTLIFHDKFGLRLSTKFSPKLWSLFVLTRIISKIYNRLKIKLFNIRKYNTPTNFSLEF